ncbi:hypothetical protein CSKR_105281, partial [Clonorchis sinensis]
MSSVLRPFIYRDISNIVSTETWAAWCSTFSCLKREIQLISRPPHVPVATIFEISRYMYIRNGLLIRLLKILRQPTTGFALLGAHQ